MLRNITDMMAEKNEKLRAGFDQTVLPCSQIRWDQTAESSASLWLHPLRVKYPHSAKASVSTDIQTSTDTCASS